MTEPEGILSPGEQRFEAARQKSGFLLAPFVFAVLWFVPLNGLEPKAQQLLAVLGAVVTLWITEAIPLAVTALFGPALCVLIGIAPAKDVFRSFADPIIFLFLGSFMIAEAMFHHGLNRRIAFSVLGSRAVGQSPVRLLLAFGGIAGVLSMWISNTATTAMMFPIGLAILSEMARRQSEKAGREIHFSQLNFSAGLMLLAAFAASIGGLATPIGTPPNLIGLGMIERNLGMRIPFFNWMLFGLPVALILIGFLVFYFNRLCPIDRDLLAGSSHWVKSQKAALGKLTRGEKNVLFAFGVAVCLWVLPGFLALIWGGDSPVYVWLSKRIPEPMVALLAAALLFVLPVNFRERKFTLTWNEARRIDWGTILLFGGGLALGELMFATGLAEWMGTGLAGAIGANSDLALIVLFTVVSALVSEMTSNTASATMVVPVAIAVATAAGVNPLQPALAATLGASMGFMLPVSTPPNAIVYGSGCVPLIKMVKYGLLLDVVGCAVIVALVHWLVPLVF